MTEHAGDKVYSYKDKVVTTDGVGEDWFLATAATAEAAYILTNSDCHAVEIVCKKSHNGSVQATATNDARIALASGETADSNPYHFLAPGDSMIVYVGNISPGGNAFFHKRDGSADCVLLVRELLA